MPVDNLSELLTRLTKNSEQLELYERMRALLSELHEYYSERWGRHLPMGDRFQDRWERARALGFGLETSIYDSALVLGDVKVGENTWIGPFTVLDGSGGLEIGSYCSISAGVQIYTHDTVGWALSGGQRGPDKAPTRIGSRCYIGPNAIIAKGVNIGDGCIVGANSLVLEDLAPSSKAVGTPCRVIGKAEI